MNIKLPFPRRSIAARGHAIYRKKVRPLVYPQMKGRIVVIDVDSGDYEVDDDDARAFETLLTRRPGARTWAERVGYRALYSTGGAAIPDNDE
ncbi:MAG: hypothetical protein OXE02_03115 [Chloroflexi bacterium]|nr:hypothetical protein [Chloroflexota bacterium]